MMTIRRRHSIIVLLSTVWLITSVHAEQTADIFVFAGQSNIQVNSTTNRENAPRYVTKDPDVEIWDVESRKFLVYEVGVNSLQPAKSPQNGGLPGNWGPESQFSYLMRRALPSKSVFIVKYGIGATQLVKEPRWADWSPASDRSEYFGQVEAILKSAKASLMREGRAPVVRAIVWMQGENEAAMGGAVAQAYEANLREWAAAARVRWGDANTKLIIGKIFKVWGKTPADYQAVASAQLAVSESTPNTFFISREPSPDYGHFLPEQTIQFGQDIFDAYTKSDK